MNEIRPKRLTFREKLNIRFEQDPKYKEILQMCKRDMLNEHYTRIDCFTHKEIVEMSDMEDQNYLYDYFTRYGKLGQYKD